MTGKRNDVAHDAPPASATAAAVPAPRLNLRRLEKLQRFLQYSAALVLLVFLGLIAVSWFQLRGINNKIANANTTLEAKQAEADALQKKINALNEEAKSKDKQIGLRNRAITALEVSKIDNSRALAPAAQIPPRIYIQIANDNQRARAAEVTRLLQDKGYIVPDIEVVGKRAPSVSQLRYYEGTYVEKDISDIISFLRGAGIKVERTRPFQSDKVRSRLYEIWFAPDF